MEEFISSNEEKLSFRIIVLEHLKGILSITIKVNDRFTFSYSQSVLALSDVLLPFYDDDMKKDYKKYEEERKGLDTANNLKESQVNVVYRRLFRKLNELLSRNNYLKTSIYTEEEET
ncbi:hypothetical protein LCGC14_2679500 [marine sediment metagenome]|uniref:Uncharacterized protein n=1 Tax=marine sediment metagenome TaxID=412755 RepID=A0A0F8ZLR7_9ZZZZ